MLGTLPPCQADAKRLRLRKKARELRREGMSYPQIAQMLGISLGSAWNIVNQ